MTQAWKGRQRVLWGGVAFGLCLAIDALMLHSVWLVTEIAPGQFQRGYFERLGAEIGVATDTRTAPDMIPAFVVTADGGLGIAPGMSVVLPLQGEVGYALAADHRLAPYVLFGEHARDRAQLVAPHTLAWQDGALAILPWQARPWREDAGRLERMQTACADPAGAPAALTVRLESGHLHLGYGRCALTAPWPATEHGAALAALAGPDWLRVARDPIWHLTHRVEWIVLALVLIKVTTLWWALGAPSAIAASSALGLAAWVVPVPAILTWPLMLAAGLAAAAVRLVGLGLRRLPRCWWWPALAAGLGALAWAGWRLAAPLPPPLLVETDPPNHRGDACAVIGYSTVKGEGLRLDHSGLRRYLDERCDRCRHEVTGLFAGGETLTWARDEYCRSPRTLGAGGQVTFLGGVNDDLFSGVFSLPRLFVGGRRSIDAWRQSQSGSVRASLDRLDQQAAALETLIACARDRGAGFLFLHDLLVTDLPAGREAERTAMRDRRKQIVTAAGGQFVDLQQAFGEEIGIHWFNDFVHLSLIGHERAAALACPPPRH